MTHSLFVATLAGAGRVGYKHADACYHLAQACAERGWTWKRACNGGAGVNRGRNLLVAEFLDTACDTFVSIDSGLTFQPKDVVRMVESPYEVVGAAYPIKGINWERVAEAAKKGMPAKLLPWLASDMVCSVTPAQFAKPLHPPGGGTFFEVDGVGTGFVVIRRHVLEQYIALSKDRIAYRTSRAFDGREAMHAVYNDERDPQNDTPSGGWKGEDYAWCQRWRMMGGQVHVYADAAVSQLGSLEYVMQLSKLLPAGALIGEAADEPT